MPIMLHHLFCLVHCLLNGVRICELPKFLVGGTTEATHDLQIDKPSDETTPLAVT